MRRIVLALLGTVSGLVLLLSYDTSLGRPGSSTAAVRVLTTGPAGAPTPVRHTAGTGAPTARTVTVDGATAHTRWGPVQVRITVTSGRLVDVTALQHPSGNPNDDRINAYALPVLRKEALAAQSANLDHVSGATVTSGGYVASLQSALDQVHL